MDLVSILVNFRPVIILQHVYGDNIVYICQTDLTYKKKKKKLELILNFDCSTSCINTHV